MFSVIFLHLFTSYNHTGQQIPFLLLSRAPEVNFLWVLVTMANLWLTPLSSSSLSFGSQIWKHCPVQACCMERNQLLTPDGKDRQHPRVPFTLSIPGISWRLQSIFQQQRNSASRTFRRQIKISLCACSVLNWVLEKGALGATEQDIINSTWARRQTDDPVGLRSGIFKEVSSV